MQSFIHNILTGKEKGATCRKVLYEKLDVFIVLTVYEVRYPHSLRCGYKINVEPEKSRQDLFVFLEFEERLSVRRDPPCVLMECLYSVKAPYSLGNGRNGRAEITFLKCLVYPKV